MLCVEVSHCVCCTNKSPLPPSYSDCNKILLLTAQEAWLQCSGPVCSVYSLKRACTYNAYFAFSIVLSSYFHVWSHSLTLQLTLVLWTNWNLVPSWNM